MVKWCAVIVDILTSKRRQYSDLAQKINDTKFQIDHTRGEVERKRAERTTMGRLLITHPFNNK